MTLWAVVLAATSWAALWAETAPPTQFAEIRFEAESHTPDLIHVLVDGLDAGEATESHLLESRQWAEILSVVARDPAAATATSLPALLGTYSLDENLLRFRPRFPPSPGLLLEATFNGEAWDSLAGTAGTPSRVATWSVPFLERASTTRVLAVSPLGPRVPNPNVPKPKVPKPKVPSNLLRFYVHFSAPMGAKQVLDAVQLLDAEGNPVPLAFVELPHGLWDSERTRLTLIVHPGRIKRGVGPHQTLGPVLAEGQRYSLEIGAGAHDIDGLPLVENYTFDFQVGPADRSSPNPKIWQPRLPRSAQGSLRLDLGEAVDAAMLNRLLRIHDAEGQRVVGVSDATPDGRHWSFQPDAPWIPGRYEIHIPVALEDLAGNRIDRPFETTSRPEAGAALPDVILAVEIGKNFKPE